MLHRKFALKDIAYMLLLALLCTMFVPYVALAEGQNLLVDDAFLLSESERTKLTEKLKEISSRHECDVAVVTVNSLNGKTAQDFADDFYDAEGYGYGLAKDGILLLVSMEDRDYHETTTGRAIDVFTDAGLEQLEDKFLPDLSDGNYYDAFDSFANQADDYLTYYEENGFGYDVGNLPKKKPVGIIAGVAAAISTLISSLTLGGMKRQLKPVAEKTEANDYLVRNSFNMTENRDIFLYTHTNRIKKPEDDDGGRSGGSSVHISSSGVSHGGHGGKF